MVSTTQKLEIMENQSDKQRLKDLMPLLQFANIDEQYANDKQLKRDDVAKLEEWQRMQPHLPSPIDPIETALFLHSCFYSNEAAKQCIDTYYTFRTHCPEFFANRDPFEAEFKKALDTCICICLPEVTPEGYMVFYMRLVDLNPDAFNFNLYTKVIMSTIELSLKQRGCHTGHVVVIDLDGITLTHLVKCGVMSIKKFLVYLQTALPLRLKSIHYVSGVSFMDKIMALVRPFLNAEMQNALHVHFGDNASIFKFVPKEILPIECGGAKFCAIDYYNNVTRKNIENSLDYFKQEARQLVDEAVRPGKPKNASDIFGVEGTFKTLDID